jgi:magnesium transporter
MARLAAHERLDDLVSAHFHRDVTLLRASQTVHEALTFLRSQPLGERIVYFYVVDEGGKLVGVVPTRRLLMADADAVVASLMVRDVVTLTAGATVKEASEMFLKHRLLAFPTVDEAGRVLGVVDLGMFTDDVSDVAARQSAEDIFQLIGAHATRSVGAWRGFADRFPWLLCNVAGGLIAAAIASWYESLLDAVIILALFMPVVLAVSESIGMQSVTLTLQSLHRERVNWRFLFASARRELATAVLLGGACGSVIGVAAWAWKATPQVGAAIAIAVTFAMATASLLGVVLPGTLRGVGRDPRIASGPIVLACTDFVTLLLYFNAARWFLS